MLPPIIVLLILPPVTVTLENELAPVLVTLPVTLPVKLPVTSPVTAPV